MNGDLRKPANRNPGSQVFSVYLSFDGDGVGSQTAV